MGMYPFIPMWLLATFHLQASLVSELDPNLLTLGRLAKDHQHNPADVRGFSFDKLSLYDIVIV